MRKYLLLITAVLLFTCGCSQAEINEDRLLSQSNDTQLEADCAPTPNISTEVMPTPVVPGFEAHSTNEMELAVDYFGDGEVVYSFSDVRLAEHLPEGENHVADPVGPFLLIDVQVRNIDVPDKSSFADRANINCFNLYKNGSEYPNIWFREPVWFSDARVDSSDPEMKSYFVYSLPAIGESKNFTLGYSMDPESISLLENGGLSLSYTISGEIVSLNYAP